MQPSPPQRSIRATQLFAVYRLVHANATQAGYRWKRLGAWAGSEDAELDAIGRAMRKPRDGRFTVFEVRLGTVVVNSWTNRELQPV